jgi:uncharacterized protein YecT (DUF1311 family)
MKRIGMTAIAFALVAYGAAAVAAESTSDLIRRDAPKGITEAFYSCIDKADSADLEEADCLSQEREAQDRRLNVVYKALLSKLDKQQKEKLVQAERAWIKLQDDTGEFEDTLYGREIIDNLQLEENEIFAICKRANELDEYLAVARGL